MVDGGEKMDEGCGFLQHFRIESIDGCIIMSETVGIFLGIPTDHTKCAIRKVRPALSDTSLTVVVLRGYTFQRIGASKLL
jgi:hypothetical protein